MMKKIEVLQKEYIVLAASWGEAIRIGDHRTANRLNKALMKNSKRFKDDELTKNLLIPLFLHANPAVRLWAAMDSLNLGINTLVAESILAAVAGDENIHVVQLMAQITLSEWNKKKSATDQSKYEPAE